LSVKSSVGEVIVGEEIVGEVIYTHTLIKYERKIIVINKRILLQINNYYTVPQIFG
jgi:hypothetical protein